MFGARQLGPSARLRVNPPSPGFLDDLVGALEVGQASGAPTKLLSLSYGGKQDAVLRFYLTNSWLILPEKLGIDSQKSCNYNRSNVSTAFRHSS